jgi:Holliday junction resolvase
MINSKRKGAAGEREWALTLRQHGWDARRGQQFSGIEGEDVVSDLRWIRQSGMRVVNCPQWRTGVTTANGW